MKISIVVPVYNPPINIFKETILSVLHQSDQDWELCLSNDGSTNSDVLEYLNELDKNEKIKIVHSTKSKGISSATNKAVEISSGEYIAFLDHDDLLKVNAIKIAKEYITKNSSPDLLYSDEDKLSQDGIYYDHFYKPDFSLDYLRSVMYFLHLMIVKTSFYKGLGGLRSEYDGAQDYDLALRVTKLTNRICHIPEILYTWRVIPGSAAEVVDAKPWALESGFLALNDCLQSLGGSAERGLTPGTFRARYPLNNELVTLVILTCGKKRNGETMVSNFVKSIQEKSTYKNYKLLIMNNGILDDDAKYILKSSNAEVINYKLDGEFNYAKAVNLSLEHIKSEFLILLNDDLEVIAPDWIEALCEPCTQPGVGAVGAKLLYPDDTVQHAGVGLGFEPWHTQHLFYKLADDEIGYQGFTHVIKNYASITGAVLATRLSTIKKLGGYDERFVSDYNDADYCLRLLQEGYRNVWTPFAKLYHFENSSFERAGTNDDGAKLFLKKWWEMYRVDPYFNKKINSYE